MSTLNKKLLFGIIVFSTFFLGCASKQPTLACYKGSSACFTQQQTVTNNCKNCVATL